MFFVVIYLKPPVDSYQLAAGRASLDMSTNMQSFSTIASKV